jgi:hypothetical protein
MSWLIILVIVLVLLVSAVLLIQRGSGEDERIRTFLRVYRHSMAIGASEAEAQAAVASLHILPGGIRTVRGSGISGETYLKHVFENEVLSVEKLVEHFIALEFPHRYPQSIDLELIRKRAREGVLGPRELLGKKVAKLAEEMGVASVSTVKSAESSAT